jgi:Xaa-Pro aminopeptidase
MAHLDRVRAERLMTQAGLDAVLLLSPESFRYATGAAPGVGTMWRRAGAVAVLLPCEAKAAAMAVVSDLFAAPVRRAGAVTDLRPTPLWVETGEGGRFRGTGTARPETFDPALCWAHVAQALAERGLVRGRIGVEMDAISARDWPMLAQALPGAVLTDASELVARLKMVKSPAEIALLRQAVTLAERGIAAVRDAAAPGVSRDELSDVWSRTIAAERGDAPLSGAWDYISVGPDPWGGNAVARRGDVIKVDVGCLMDGYTSDSGRTFVLGPPSADQARAYAALHAGFRAGLAVLGPGVALSHVHRVTEKAIRAAGIEGFTRGHFGHGLGAGLGSEEWPFISAASPVLAEPGMVLAFECPWYVTGLGGFIVENQLLVTKDGIEVMNRLPDALVELVELG